jgi:hypothetical protein
MYANMQDFPYNFPQGVEHHNLWSETPLAGEQLLKVGIEQHRERI